MSRLRIAAAVAACAAVLALPACGSDGEPERDAAATEEPTATPTPDRGGYGY